MLRLIERTVLLKSDDVKQWGGGCPDAEQNIDTVGVCLGVVYERFDFITVKTRDRTTKMKIN